MGPILILLGAIIGIVIWVLICKEFRNVAECKGFSEEKYFWLPFWLGVIGILLVIALPDRGVQNVSMPYATAPESQPVVISDELPDL